MSSMSGFTGLTGPSGRVGNKLPRGLKLGQISQFTPQQQELFSQLFGNVGPESYLSRLAQGDENVFQEMEAPALRQFSQLQGGLASRFSGMGGLGARKSSGFYNTSNAQASELAERLAGNRQQLQRQALNDLMNISNQLLGQRPYENFTYNKQPREGVNWGGLAVGALGAAVGGPGGALTGYQAGSALSGHSANPFGGRVGQNSAVGMPSANQFSNWDFNQYLPLMGNV